MTSSADVIVIGAGQCGLAVGYHLARQKRSFVILDSAPRIGHSWRIRYDSLKLFTPSVINNLPGMAFPRIGKTFPTKDDMADYLEDYAKTLALPVHLNAPVRTLRRGGEGYVAVTPAGLFEAPQVIIATGFFQRPAIPAFASQLSDAVFQVHSAAYRNPSQIPGDGAVLVVGAANSGAQIALEIALHREAYLSCGGKPFYSSPQWLLNSVLAWRLSKSRTRAFDRRLKLPWPLGPQPFFVGDFFKRAKKRDVKLLPRAVDAEGERVVLADGSRITVDAVVWATGYSADYSWIEVPILDENGSPIIADGARAAGGLYFIGLWRQRTHGSALISGVPADAAYVAELAQREAPRPSARDPAA